MATIKRNLEDLVPKKEAPPQQIIELTNVNYFNTTTQEITEVTQVIQPTIITFRGSQTVNSPSTGQTINFSQTGIPNGNYVATIVLQFEINLRPNQQNIFYVNVEGLTKRLLNINANETYRVIALPFFKNVNITNGTFNYSFQHDNILRVLSYILYYEVCLIKVGG